MARTKRTTRGTRAKPASKPAAALNLLRANAAQVRNIAAARASQARKLALARTREVRQAVMAGADVARSRTVAAVSKFERVFQDRVTRVISRLGVPTARDVRALSRQVAQLQQSVDGLRRARARA